VKNRSVFVLAHAVAIVAAALLGCGGSDLGAEVSGTVTLDGKPVGPGVIVFASKGAARNPAEGAIQPDGSYFLKTSRDVGLLPDSYAVAVSVFEDPEVAAGERSTVPSKLVTPEKYASHETSGLEYEVRPGGNTIDIELVSR
jgi:hypothetical protein